MIAIDIDFFKKVNDTYGHVLGDEILIELANAILKTIRKYDIASRFGGEEFFILLPQTNRTRANIVAKRLLNCPQKNKLLKKYNVTLSLGVTEYKEKDSLNKMVKRCDKALYQSKNNGRNQVSII